MESLRYMYNEFYSYIFPKLRYSIINAIEDAEIHNETHIITPMSTLITLLYNQYDPYLAVNIYLKDPLVSDSVTRKHFFDLFQEEVKDFQEEKKENENQDIQNNNQNNLNNDQNVIEIEASQNVYIDIDFNNYSIYL